MLDTRCHRLSSFSPAAHHKEVSSDHRERVEISPFDINHFLDEVDESLPVSGKEGIVQVALGG